MTASSLVTNVQPGGERPLIRQPSSQTCAVCHQPTLDRPKLSSAFYSGTGHRLHLIFVTGFAAAYHARCSYPCSISLAIFSVISTLLGAVCRIPLLCSSLISATCFCPQTALALQFASPFYLSVHSLRSSASQKLVNPRSGKHWHIPNHRVRSFPLSGTALPSVLLASTSSSSALPPLVVRGAPMVLCSRLCEAAPLYS
jgi:hypothetical protein